MVSVKFWNNWLAVRRNHPYFTAPWKWEMALEMRIPALFILAYAVHNTILYSEANHAWKAGGKVTTTKGKLLEMQRHFNTRLALPRYSVKYEFEVDGKKYIATRATTGSPYRNWMEGWYLDTITEAQYLQAIPVLRVGEPCTVYYRKSNPGKYSALAHDGNSFEISTLVFFGTFPLIFGTSLKGQFFVLRRWLFPRRQQVRLPDWALPDRHPPKPAANATAAPSGSPGGAAADAAKQTPPTA
jgi:hypothetical protein